MQGKYPLDYSFTEPLKQKYKISELESRGIHIDTGAPVTGAVAVGRAVAASFGDGTVRFFGLTAILLLRMHIVALCFAWHLITTMF